MVETKIRSPTRIGVDPLAPGNGLFQERVFSRDNSEGRPVSGLKVLSIDENSSNNAYLDAVFRGAPLFKVTHQSSGSVNYSQLKAYNLIILNGLRSISSGLSSELVAYCKNGGNALVFPSANADIANYNSTFAAFGGGNLPS